jgi:hypothetical protein
MQLKDEAAASEFEGLAQRGRSDPHGCAPVNPARLCGDG